MKFSVNLSASPAITQATIVRIIENHAADGEWVSTRDHTTCLSTREGASVLVLDRYPSFLCGNEILAVEPLYQRLGDAVHSTDSYCFSKFKSMQLRLILRDLCVEAVALGVPLWVHWNCGLAIASAADMLEVLRAIPDFDWPESEPRLDPRLRDSIYGRPPEWRGAGGAVVERSNDVGFGKEHTFISEMLPGIDAIHPAMRVHPAGSLCLYALDEASGDVLNWFHAIARGVRARDASQRFYATSIYAFGNPWDLQDRTRYCGPQLNPPLVTLRLPGAPEWHGEGAAAMEKLRSLAAQWSE